MSDLPPLPGFEGKQCGGRHGGPFGRDKSNFRLELGARKGGRYPDAHAVCRYCGTKVPGVAAELFPDELDAATERHRSEKHKRDRWFDRPGGGTGGYQGELSAADRKSRRESPYGSQRWFGKRR